MTKLWETRSLLFRVRLQFIVKDLFHLFHLGADDGLAVTLVGILGVIVEMVILRPPELVKRLDLGHDWAGEDSGGVELVLVFLRQLSLLVAVVENHRPVLWPVV